MQITANGITLEYEEVGPKDGPALVLIRGLGSQLAHWAPEFYTGFADHGFRVVMFDNRDVGQSARCPGDGVDGKAETILAEVAAGRIPRAAYTLRDMARDVTGLMEALGIDRAHGFGMSMGGGIAQILASEHGDRFHSMTICMSRPGFTSQGQIDRLVSYPETEEEYVKTSLYWDEVWGNPGFPVPRDHVVAQAKRAYARGADAAGVNRQMLAIMNTGDLRGQITGIALPCLVIHGAQDTLIPPQAGREIAALIPGAELQVIDGMGHAITPSLAPVIVDMMTDFIRRRAADAAPGAQGM